MILNKSVVTKEQYITDMIYRYQSWLDGTNTDLSEAIADPVNGKEPMG